VHKLFAHNHTQQFKDGTPSVANCRPRYLQCCHHHKS